MAADVKKLKYLIEFEANNNTEAAVKALKATLQQLGMQMTKVKDETGKQAQGFDKLRENLNRLMSRAVLTIPIWMALRGAMNLVTSTIQDGFKYWIDYEKAMTRAKATIRSSTISVKEAVGELEQTIATLTKNTSDSAAKLVDAFYNFSEIGLSFEESMTGMQASLKTSKALMGDLNEISKVMAHTYLLLGDSLEKNLSVQQKQELMGAKIYKLWQDNAFEINEFDEALSNFLPTAKTMNITFDQTISLLASLHQAAMRAGHSGTLLRTTFSKVAENYKDIANVLGLYVNADIDKPFDILMKVLAKLSEYEKTGRWDKISGALDKIFGGVRGGEPVRALVSVFDIFGKNLAAVATEGDKAGEMMKTFNERVNEVNSSLPELVAKTEKLKQEIGAAFLQGLLGGEDFKSTMKELNLLLAGSIELAKNLGAVLRTLGSINAFNALILLSDKINQASNKFKLTEASKAAETLQKAFTGGMTPEEMRNLAKKIENFQLEGMVQLAQGSGRQGYGEFIKRIIADLRKAADNIEVGVDIKPQISPESKDKLIEETQKTINESNTSKGPKAILDDRDIKELNLKREGVEILRQEAAGYNDVAVAHFKLYNYVQELVDQYNKTDAVIKGSVKALTSEEIVTLGIKGNWEGILQLTKENIINKKELLKIAELIANEEEKILQAQKEYTNVAKSAVSSEIGNYLKTGKGTIRNVKETLRNAQADAASQAITEKLFDITGLGAMYGDMTTKMRYAFDEGAQLTYKAITQGFSDGASGKTGGSFEGGKGGSGGGGFLGGLFDGSKGKDGKEQKPSGFNQFLGVAGSTFLGAMTGRNNAAKFLGGLGGLGTGLQKAGWGGAFGKTLGNMSGVLQIASLFADAKAGGKKGAEGHAYATGDTSNLVSAETRMTTKAKVNNIVISPVFNLGSMAIDQQNTIKQIEDKISVNIKQVVTKILEDEQVTTGNV